MNIQLFSILSITDKNNNLKCFLIIFEKHIFYNIRKHLLRKNKKNRQNFRQNFSSKNSLKKYILEKQNHKK